MFYWLCWTHVVAVSGVCYGAVVDHFLGRGFIGLYKIILFFWGFFISGVLAVLGNFGMGRGWVFLGWSWVGLE